MKLFGISIGSLILARCQRTATPTPNPTFLTCYTVVPPTGTPVTPTPMQLASRIRMRLCWLRFPELAKMTRDGQNPGTDATDEDLLRQQMIAEHRDALDELVGAGEITAPVADLIHEAYAAAVFHIWRSNALMTCYFSAMIEYTPASADNLVRQAEALSQVAAGGTIEPDTVAKTRAALEHDLAFYALTDEEIQTLYTRLLEENSDPGERIPSFDELDLILTPEVRAAAQFLLDVLMGI